MQTAQAQCLTEILLDLAAIVAYAPRPSHLLSAFIDVYSSLRVLSCIVRFNASYLSTRLLV